VFTEDIDETDFVLRHYSCRLSKASLFLKNSRYTTKVWENHKYGKL